MAAEGNASLVEQRLLYRRGDRAAEFTRQAAVHRPIDDRQHLRGITRIELPGAAARGQRRVQHAQLASLARYGFAAAIGLQAHREPQLLRSLGELLAIGDTDQCRTARLQGGGETEVRTDASRLAGGEGEWKIRAAV